MKSQEIGKIGKIIIPEKIENYINYLHKTIGATEWSGILFYKLTSGNINKLKDLQFTVEMIYPMNIGTSAYTEFDYNSEVMNAYELSEELISCSTGLSHSHHSMSCFFSKDDTEELLDNCKNFNYYISLIVNFDKNYKCKIAFPTKAKVNKEYTIKNNEGKFIKAKSSVEEEIILVGDLEIEFENKVEIEEWIVKRVAELKNQATEKAKAKTATVFTPSNSYTAGRSPYQSTLFNEENYGNFNQKSLVDNWKPSSNIITPKEFLVSLINLSDDFRHLDIVSSIASLELNEVDKDDYSDMMSAQLEDIHDSLYKSNIALKFHCKSALTELDKHQNLFGDMDYYNIIKENLEMYAEF